MIIPLVVLALVFLLIAVRQVGGFRIRIWQIMLGGAAAVLLLGQISIPDAIRSINPDVMIFLFGMFVVGVAVTESGYLYHAGFRILSRGKTPDRCLLLLILMLGLFSAVLMNDTVAIIGTPLVITFAIRTGFPVKGALLALCFAITIGSVATPIGNPQNVLVASSADLGNGFIPFLVYLGIPTLISLLIAWMIVRRRYPAPGFTTLSPEPEPVSDPGLARLSLIALALLLALIGVRTATGLIDREPFPLMVIAVAAAAPILAASPRRIEILRKVDWYTLIFFAAMFVLMQSVYNTGFFQAVIGSTVVSSVPVIMTVAVILSQFISNVPFVALFQPVIIQQGMAVQQVLALAAGSTIAGNLTILGAASNVIVIQQAEKEGYSLSFREFVRLGLPLTILNIVVYSLFLSI